MATPYSRGRAFEYRVKKLYEAMGWIVFRTAGSHSPADLICMARDVILVQCKYSKSGRMKWNKKELRKLQLLLDRLKLAGYVAFNDEKGHIHLKLVGEILDD